MPALACGNAAAAAAEPLVVSEARLKSDVERLSGFGTRHTLSSESDPKRGIGAARHWAEAEFRKTGAACGNCLEIVLPDQTVSGERIPGQAHIVDVVAIQRGSQRPNEVVIVQAHIDSRASDVMDATSDAPGANDDGSGCALVLEAARVLTQRKFPATIVYALLQGEEQAGYGAKLLAAYAKAQGWTIKAVLNNDIVGNSRGSDGLVDNSHVRIFSEGMRGDANEALRAQVRFLGGENDSPSRNLSRFIAGIPGQPLQVRQVWRTDRLGRGGDHMPFQEAGHPAIRFTVAVENYYHQHQNLRRENGVEYGDTAAFMDFAYLANVTRLNIASLERLAGAPMPPVVRLSGAVSTDTELRWDAVDHATGYHVYRRATNAADWGEPIATVAASIDDTNALTNQPLSLRLTGVRADDWIFGVSSLAGHPAVESPIASAVPGGQFAPLAK